MLFRSIDPTDYFRDEDYTIPYFKFERFDDNKNMNNYFVMEWDYKNEAGLDYPIEVWVAPHYVSEWMEKGGGVKGSKKTYKLLNGETYILNLKIIFSLHLTN